MSATKWGGRTATNKRRDWAKRLPVLCCRCGRPVLATQAWQVDHYPIPREHGGTETWPAHAKCNLSAGGKRGAQLTNARRARPDVKTTQRERSRGIRGV